ncbi:hypothetical protein BKH17_04525 [Actinomyces oris]|uniref:hypothetical protein n=1 Tax=Actinomyces TaxID=1654 RepID=UPI000949E53B|nr:MULTISPECIES: hypothetical protein [Actinomyces]OLL12596.1 hypothetical protein BKH17_04525 [Actinomyces oris]QLF54332.1 hypothetical protein HW274_11500 [Actinomyces sp. oral taxon 169]
MRWDFSLRWRALGDPVSEGRRVWEWIQQVRPLHPSLALWRPTAESREEAEQSPPITQDYLLHLIHGVQAISDDPDFGLTPAFSGQIDQGNKLMLSFNMPNPGDASVDLMVGEALGAALDASEDLADALMHTTASIFTPGAIGALTREDIPVTPTPPPYRYLPGWKMFFASDSPHYQRATQLATRTAPVANGAIFTFGTPNTYPTILNQW